MYKSNLKILLKSIFIDLPLAFSLFINKAIKPWKITNMHSVSLNHFSDYILVLNSIRNRPTQNECFCMHFPFTTIYLLHKQKLNHGNYSEQELNMKIFVQDNEYDVHMFTKFQEVCKYRYFYTNLTLFCLFSIYI
jgi:hypothetical protein